MNPGFLHPVPTPAEVLGWLINMHWVEVERTERWVTLRQEGPGGVKLVDVPLLQGAVDYPRAVTNLFLDLAELEGRSPDALLYDVRSACLDIVRFRLNGSSLSRGSLPLDASVGTLQAVRDLCLAAACTSIEPRSAYLGRKPQQALAFLDEARWGRVESGSVVLCLEVPVPPQLQGSLVDEAAPDAEFVRRVTRQLMLATSSLERLLPECAAANSLEAAVRNVESGVSSNLCEAMIRLMEQGGADEASLSVAFAPRRPVPSSVPRRATFRKSDVPLLREIARGLQVRAEEADTEAVGPVVRLESTDPARGGVVTLQVELQGRTRLVRLEVTSDDYAVAVKAHEGFRFVRAEGTLRTSPTGLTLVSQTRLRITDVRERE